MPLKKLWNSLTGRSAEPKMVAESKPNHDASKSSRSKGSVAIETPASQTLASQPLAKSKRPPTPRRGVLSMITKGHHDALLKLLKRRKPNSVLEIGIGDGSRMPAILTSLFDAEDVEPLAIKAAVIDEFEMGSGEVTVRDYHRQLKGLPLRPAIFPEPIPRGLASVSNRLGRMDVVLIDATIAIAQAEVLDNNLSKVLHETSLVLSNESGKWVERTITSKSRRAA